MEQTEDTRDPVQLKPTGFLNMISFNLQRWQDVSQGPEEKRAQTVSAAGSILGPRSLQS